MNMDLRAEMESLLQEYGHDIVYVRTNKALHCRCWNEQQQSSNPRCTTCFGTGYVVRPEIHRVRSRTASVPLSYPSLLQHEEPVVTDDPAYFFYMKWNSMPAVGDLILDVFWQGKVPILTRAYEINFPEPNRGQGGRIEYWRVAAKAMSQVDVYALGLRQYNVHL